VGAGRVLDPLDQDFSFFGFLSYFCDEFLATHIMCLMEYVYRSELLVGSILFAELSRVALLASSVFFRYDSRLSNSVPKTNSFFIAMWSLPCWKRGMLGQN
jgi:hypothetical protein